MAIAVILGILFMGLTIGGAIFGGIKLYSSLSDYGNHTGEKGHTVIGIISIIVAVVCLILFIFIPFSYHQVDEGETAVVKRYGEIVDVRDPGLHFDFWMTNTYVTLDSKVRQVDITTASYSNDKQTMDITMTIQYQIKKDMAKELVRTYGNLDTLESRIQSVSIERTKAIMSAYTADSLIEQRNIISNSVAEAVEAALGEAYYIDITNVALTNIDFSDAYEQAVEQKMIATQEVERAKAEAQKAEETAKGQLMVAEQEAKAKKVQAQADAEATRIKAEAEANAIQIKSLEVARMLGLTEIDAEGSEKIKSNITADEASLIAEYLKYIEYLATWDGKLPEVMTDGNTLIQVPTGKN